MILLPRSFGQHAAVKYTVFLFNFVMCNSLDQVIICIQLFFSGHKDILNNQIDKLGLLL